MNQRLVGHGLFGGEAAELRGQRWSDADGDELGGVPCPGPADVAGAPQLS